MLFTALLRHFAAIGLIYGLVFSSPALSETLRGVGFGDSLMAGYQLNNGEGFPEQLEAALKKKGLDVVITNAGVSGDTTSGGLARMDWSVGDDVDFVILELGANDALRGISPDISNANLDQMIESLKARNIDVLLAGMLAPPNMGDEYGQAFNAIYPALAAKHDVPLYPFFLEGVITEPSLLLSDGIHPNAQGVARMVEQFVPFFEKWLADRS